MCQLPALRSGLVSHHLFLENRHLSHNPPYDYDSVRMTSNICETDIIEQVSKGCAWVLTVLLLNNDDALAVVRVDRDSWPILTDWGPRTWEEEDYLIYTTS